MVNNSEQSVDISKAQNKTKVLYRLTSFVICLTLFYQNEEKNENKQIYMYVNLVDCMFNICNVILKNAWGAGMVRK